MFAFSCTQNNMLDGLIRDSHFTRDELQQLYRTFKEECPDGTINQENFAMLYSRLTGQFLLDVIGYARKSV